MISVGSRKSIEPFSPKIEVESPARGPARTGPLKYPQGPQFANVQNDPNGEAV